MNSINITPYIDTRYIVFEKKIHVINKYKDGLWRDAEGTIFAFADGVSVDPNDVCGVGLFSLPKGHPLNEVCARHDFAFSCPAYQTFYTRAEADQYLADLATKAGYKRTGILFKWISKIFGVGFWENKKTR